jgi:hypothetical protein
MINVGRIGSHDDLANGFRIDSKTKLVANHAWHQIQSIYLRVGEEYRVDELEVLMDKSDDRLSSGISMCPSAF